MNIQEELLIRYKYLYDNKELILANCIMFSIEKEYIKNKLKELKRIVKKTSRTNKNQDLIILLKDAITSYKADLKKAKPYLSSKIPDEYINMMEELILGDADLEETKLFMFIEFIKNNEELLNNCYCAINALDERRSKNQHLKKRPTFTVWKILSYVRKKYLDNEIVLAALDKYYNLDRFTIANDDCSYGYYIPEGVDDISYDYPDLSLYGSVYDSSVVLNYKGNKFEEEDEYYDSAPNKKITDNFYPTQFANDLANSEMIQNKKVLENFGESKIYKSSL